MYTFYVGLSSPGCWNIFSVWGSRTKPSALPLLLILLESGPFPKFSFLYNQQVDLRCMFVFTFFPLIASMFNDFFLTCWLFLTANGLSLQFFLGAFGGWGCATELFLFEGLNKLKTWIVDNTHPSCNKQNMGGTWMGSWQHFEKSLVMMCVCVCVCFLLLVETKNRSRCKTVFQYYSGLFH